MKVVAINGSPHRHGNTWHALKMVTAELEAAGIKTEIVTVGDKAIRGCIACGLCAKSKNGQCVPASDEVNAWIQKMKQADGILLGSPVHNASMPAAMKSFLDRTFYVARMNGGLFRHKVGASVVAVRSSNGLPTFNQLNNFLMYSEMLIPTSNYLNVIHAKMPGEVAQEQEGAQIMRVLGKNMAWLLKLVEHGKGVAPPEQEQRPS